MDNFETTIQDVLLDYIKRQFDDLPQYHFDRDAFVDVFKGMFTIDDMENILDLCDGNMFVGDFHLFHNEDEYYILHMPSGTMINWYKHLGRTNTCNKDLDLDGLKQFLMMLYEDLSRYWG